LNSFEMSTESLRGDTPSSPGSEALHAEEEDATLRTLAKAASTIFDARERLEAVNALSDRAWARSHAALQHYTATLQALHARTVHLTKRARVCAQRAAALAAARGVSISHLDLGKHNRALKEEEQAEYAQAAREAVQALGDGEPSPARQSSIATASVATSVAAARDVESECGTNELDASQTSSPAPAAAASPAPPPAPQLVPPVALSSDATEPSPDADDTASGRAGSGDVSPQTTTVPEAAAHDVPPESPADAVATQALPDATVADTADIPVAEETKAPSVAAEPSPGAVLNTAGDEAAGGTSG
jgi:hypothetical protein